MFTAAEFGLLLRLVLAGIDSEQNAAGQYRPDRLAAAWSRRLSPLRTVERKLRRQREHRRPAGQQSLASRTRRTWTKRQLRPDLTRHTASPAGPKTLSASWRSARPGGS